ncbi:MAG TPA: hypothetical protein VFZ21_12220 [Gemmatimonadaceae bacterium]|jgi:hypothetical protein|nr:hypothetical protein [Gemmatimonadaceae bacterium]
MLQFTLAARLGMTVGELRERLDYDEWMHWLAWMKLNPETPRL